MSQFYTILTTVGQAKIAAAIASGVPLELTDMAIGDGNGAETTPTGTETSLYRQVYTGEITNKQERDDMPGVVIVEFVVPMTSGGYTVREVGVFDADGDMIAIGNFPATPKTLIAEGSARELTVRTYLQVNETSAVTIVIDPTFTMASRQWVIDNFVEKNRMRGGLNNQVLTKKSNLDLDWEWRNIGDTPITVNSQVETQTLAASQTVVNLTFRTTQGMALFIEGYRSFEFTINNPTQFTLSAPYPAGTQIWVVQNEPEGSLTNYDRKTGGGTLLNGGRYLLDDSLTYTLQPVSALQIGSSVALAKPKGKVPKINVNGANGEKILSNLGDLTTFEFRSDAHLQFVFNGTNWEVLNDVTLADAKAAIRRRATLSCDFVNNIHTVTEQFGPERKQLTEALSTSRNSTATYQSPTVVGIAAINTPRVTFDETTGDPLGLLCEEQRTNLLLNPQYTGASGETPPTGWAIFTNTGVTTTANSPRFSGAIRAKHTGTSQREAYYRALILAANTTYTVSAYFAAGTSADNVVLRVATEGGDTPTGTLTLNGSAVTAAGTYSITFTTGATGGTYGFYIGLGCTGNATGTVIHETPQLEQGSALTSYNPNTGVAAPRSADLISEPLRLSNNNAGTIYIEFDMLTAVPAGLFTSVVKICDAANTGNRGFALRLSDNTFAAMIRNDTDVASVSLVVSNASAPKKALVSFDNQKLKLLLAVDGAVVEVAISSAVDLSAYMSHIFIAGATGISGTATTHSKTVKLYEYTPRATSAAEARTLTL